MKRANIYQDLVYNETKPVISVLLETDFTKEIRIALHKGTHMKEHKTAYPIVIEVVSGNINFGIAHQQVLNLTQGDMITLASNIPHDLTANENSVVRLTLAKQDNAQRVENVVNS